MKIKIKHYTRKNGSADWRVYEFKQSKSGDEILEFAVNLICEFIVFEV